MPRRKLGGSLIGRLVVSFLGLSLVTVAIVAVVAFGRAREALGQAVIERLGAAAAVREQQLTRWVDQQRVEVEHLATLAEIHAALPGRRQAGTDSALVAATQRRLGGFLANAVTMKVSLRELFVLSVPGGRVLASSNPASVGGYRVGDEYFLSGRTGTFVENVYPSPMTGKPSLSIGTPLRDGADSARAVLAAHLDLEQLDRIISDSSGLGATGEAYLVDQFHDFVTAQRFGRDRFLRGVNSIGIRAAVAEHRTGAGAYLNYAGVPVIGAYRWVAPRQLALLVEMEQAEAFGPARRLAVVILVVGLLSAGILVFGIYLIARQIARPVLAIAAAAERVAGGDFGARAPVTTEDEIGRMAATFNGMTERLHRLYQEQEQQVEAVSRAAAAAAESKRLLQAIIDNTPAYVSVASLDGHVLLLNRAAAGVYRIDRDAAVGRSFREFVPPDHYQASMLAGDEAVRAGGPIGREEVRQLDGEERTWFVVRFPIQPADRRTAVCTIATDITEVKRAEAERAAFSEQLQHTQKLESLGVLAGGIAHDFNNLLTAILGHGGLILGDLPADSRSREDAELIVRAAQRASELTNQMLAYAGRGKVVSERIDLNATVTEMTELLRVSIPKKVEFRHRLAEALPPIEGDAAQLQQVVMNLITNAAEAIGDRVGSITLETGVVTIEKEGTTGGERCAPGRYVQLVVADTGVGMDRATASRIFEPFFTTKFTGRGLGLAAVQGIIRRHRGWLGVDSALGIGTTFVVRIPVAAPATASPPVLPPSSVGQVPEDGTVLVVEDEDSVRGLAERTLRRHGYRVLLARDGAEAVNVFRRSHAEIDTVVLDLTMPVMDGRQTLAAIRLIDPEVRVILSSGYTEHDHGAWGDAGGALFLQKPYLPSELLTIVAASRLRRDRHSAAS